MQTILSHTYENGLVLVAEPMQSLESAAFTILIPAGGVYDPVGEEGLASLTCEMALRGCGSRDNRQFVTDLDNLGVERGESVGDSHASFSGATLAKNLPAALAIYADVLLRPRMDAAEFEPARQMLIQEIRGIEDDPAQKVMLELRRRQYAQPWGRPSHGEIASLEGIPLDAVVAAHRQFYRPNGAIIGLAGRIDWPRLLDQVGQLLGDWQPRPVQAPAHGERSPIRDHLHHESNQTQIAIGYESVPYSHPDYFQAWGGVGVLSGGMSARLFTEVREKRGLCYSVYATHHTLRERGSVFCYAGTSAERAQETLEVTLRELTRLAEGIQEQELTRLKARIKSALIMQQESSSARSGSLARDWYHLGRPRTLDEVGELIEGLSAESINAFLAQHPPREFTIVTLGPAPLEVPVGIP